MVSSLYRIKREVLYNELSGLFSSMDMIRYAVIKGEVLSEQIYGLPYKRRSNDIDILIEKRDMKLIEDYLRGYGFNQCGITETSNSRFNRIMCISHSHQIPSYHKEKYGFHLNVDLNHDVFWGEYEGVRISMDEFLSDTVNMNVYGVTVKTLAIDKSFVQLILHHYKEMNSLFHLSQHNTIKEDMFLDIFGFLITNSRVLTLDCVSSLCAKYSIGAYVYYMLYYTNLVFKNEMLKRYVDCLESYKDELIMESYGLLPRERKIWSIPFEKRLNNKILPEYVCAQLSDDDREKIESNRKIFR